MARVKFKQNKMPNLFLIGFSLIFLGIIFLIVASFSAAKEGNEVNTNFQGGFGGFIGPIPFGFFTSKQALWIWIIISVVFVVLWIAIQKVLR